MYWLVWHSAIKGNNAVDIVKADSADAAEVKANYDGTYRVERYDKTNTQHQQLTEAMTRKGWKAIDDGEAVRIGEWHL